MTYDDRLLPHNMGRLAKIAVVVACLSVGALLFGQRPNEPRRTASPNAPPATPPPHERIIVPGTNFTPEGLGRNVRVDSVNDGRRFRGNMFARLFLRAPVKLPARALIVGLAVHFRTSDLGPSLRSVELLEGREAVFHLSTLARGDFISKEIFKPKSPVNAWSFKDDPYTVPAGAAIRLEVQFPGGIDSQINPGEFVLTGVAVDFVQRR